MHDRDVDAVRAEFVREGLRQGELATFLMEQEAVLTLRAASPLIERGRAHGHVVEQ